MKMSAKDKFFEVAKCFGLHIVEPDKNSKFIFDRNYYYAYIGNIKSFEDLSDRNEQCILKYSNLDRTLWIPKRLMTSHSRLYFHSFYPVCGESATIENIKEEVSQLIILFKKQLNELNKYKIEMDFV